jgi:hypothetical protein
MGYHREPCHFPERSCLEGEMHRRIWAVIHIFGSSMSMLSGSPKPIAEGLWDTKNTPEAVRQWPRSSCTPLPESRLDSKLTPVLCPLPRYKLSLIVSWLIYANVSQSLISASEKRCAEALVATAVLSAFLHHLGTWLKRTGGTDSIDVPDIEGTLRSSRTPGCDGASGRQTPEWL